MAKEKRRLKRISVKEECALDNIFFKSGNLSKESIKITEWLLKKWFFFGGGDYFKNYALKLLEVFPLCRDSHVTMGSLVKSGVVTVQGCQHLLMDNNHFEMLNFICTVIMCAFVCVMFYFSCFN